MPGRRSRSMAALKPAISPAIPPANVSVDPLFIGGEFGNYSARLSGAGFLEQDAATIAGQHYIVSFYVAGDADASASSLDVYWDGALILAQTDVAAGFTKYTFDLVGDAWTRPRNCSSTSPPTAPGFWSTRFRSRRRPVRRPRRPAEASPSPMSRPPIPTPRASRRDDSGYVGTFSLDPVSESGGSGSLAWHYSVNNSDIQFLAQGQTLVQTYYGDGHRRPRRLHAADRHHRDRRHQRRADRGQRHRSLPTPDPTAPSSSRRGRWGRTTPIRIRPTMSPSTASAPAPAAARAALSASYSSPTTPRSADRSPTMPPTVTRPAAISPPRPSSTTPPRPRRSPAPAPTKS